MLYIPSTGTANVQLPSGPTTVSLGANGLTATGGLANSDTSITSAAASVCGAGTYATTCQSSNVASTFTASRIAGTGALANSTYGLVTINDPSGGPEGKYTGGYHVGTVTPGSDMPANVTATYTGSYTGVAYQSSNATNISPVGQSGAVNITANFGTGAVSGTVTNLQNGAGSAATAAGYGLSMNGSISGATYTGTAGYTNAAGTAPAGTVTGSQLSGAFYGPRAAETAGAIGIRGTAPAGGAIATVGAFGAIKN